VAAVCTDVVRVGGKLALDAVAVGCVEDAGAQYYSYYAAGYGADNGCYGVEWGGDGGQPVGNDHLAGVEVEDVVG